jgi:hypothetical protein
MRFRLARRCLLGFGKGEGPQGVGESTGIDRRVESAGDPHLEPITRSCASCIFSLATSASTSPTGFVASCGAVVGCEANRGAHTHTPPRQSACASSARFAHNASAAAPVVSEVADAPQSTRARSSWTPVRRPSAVTASVHVS